ncbi:TIGR04423 family type III CRISPR-associated protein [Helicobacter sp. T3_23-1056]
MKNFDELKAQFSALQSENNKFEGYILMSDKEIKECLIDSPQILPSFDLLHNERNFIVEAGLFCAGTNECICIRHINNGFLFKRFCLNDYPHIDFENFIAINGKAARIAQIWEEVCDEVCENLPVLTHKFSVFAGFEKNIDSTKGGENG